MTNFTNFLKRLFPVFLVGSAVVSGVFAQDSGEKTFVSEKTISELKKIQSASLTNEYAYEMTRFMTNNIGPRLSGSPQADRAVQFVADEMRKLGLEVSLQEVSVPHWVRGAETGELTEFPGMAPGTVQKLSLTALGMTVATPVEGLTAEVVAVDDFDHLKRLGREGVEGKIVFFNNKFDYRMAEAGRSLEAYGIGGVYRRDGPVEAAKLGAVAAIIRSVGSSRNQLAHTGATRIPEDVDAIPAAAVSFESGELIADLAKRGTLRMKLVLTPRTFPDKLSHNVLADLKGSEKPDEIVVVSGHLDSWDLGTGALDDAVGVAMAMQVVKVIKDLGLRPKRTIRVVAFMNEENGFRGARKYAEEADASKHAAALESDLGASHPTGFLFAGSPEAMSLFDPIVRILGKQGAGFVARQPNVSSDISLLTQKGVPSFAPQYDTREYFNYHHNAADTFDKVKKKELNENASLMAVIAYAIANSEMALPR